MTNQATVISLKRLSEKSKRLVNPESTESNVDMPLLGLF